MMRIVTSFQSHNGAIAAILSMFTGIRTSLFQSHNGAIAAKRLLYFFDEFLRFNPTMVRLLHFRVGRAKRNCRCFNPTMVRLLRPKGDRRNFERVGFNPTMVRLLPIKIAADLYERVSIPQWCDCCPECACHSRCIYARFNPTMVRLLPKENSN